MVCALSQYEDRLSSYGDSHYKDRTVVKPSRFYHGDPYTGSIPYYLWDGLQVSAHAPDERAKVVFVFLSINKYRVLTRAVYFWSTGK